ncbi:S1C family serine protease [Salininema proteolyticum]|uniref:S1C family serine protease n=1 Tax=Salininema proteolyticum TaxID=1607685 RepID=A0ABV8TYH1_9ACTN
MSAANSPGPQATPPPLGGSSASWNPGAAEDPWRNPQSPAQVRLPAPPPPPTEPSVPPPPAPKTVGLGAVTVLCAVTAVIASVLGAVLSTYLLGDLKPVTGTTSAGGDPVVDRDPDSVAGVVEEILPSVVTILTPDGGNGSGFVISKEGHILTNHHVAAAGSDEPVDGLQVQFSDGRIFEAEPIGSDPASDVAVIKIEGEEFQPMKLADSDKLASGDPVIAIGAPLGLSSTVTTGIVSALDRPVMTQSDDGSTESVMAAIQTDAAINPGNSGGALTDMAGQVVGINSAIASFANEQGQAGNIGIGFAIPINQAKRIADEIIETGKASRTVFGATLGRPKAGVGVELQEIVKDSPAERAGLKSGDVLLSFSGKPVTDNTELVALVRKHAPGESVTVEYRRDGEDDSVQVELAAGSD